MKNHSEEILFPKELLKKLKELIETESLEMIRDNDEPGIVRIPYMMSDAIENYIQLENCRVNGDIDDDFEIGTSIRISSSGTELSIILCAPDGRLLRIDCSRAIQHVTLYQYHRTGHYWVEGNEFLRRLVYIVGTVHDKAEFMGRKYCNDVELSYYHLIEFAPFRYWSPIDESMDDWYHNSAAGTETMRKLAKEAGDMRFLWMIDQYTESHGIRNVLAKYLSGSDGDRIMECLWKKIIAGSLPYEVRRYGAQLENRIDTKREAISEALLADGYTGNYPVFRKDETEVCVIEEHPFTIMEWEKTEYKFHLEFREETNGKVSRRVIHENL